MNKLDERLVNHLLEEMQRYNAKFSKFIGQVSEDYDIQDKTFEVIRNFPWPIGRELMRLFSNQSLDRGRLDQLFKTLERTMQYISFVLLSQLLEEIINKRVELDDEFNKNFQDRFVKISLGNYAWLIRNIGSIYNSNKLLPFMNEMNNIFNEEFYKSLEFLVPPRNDIGHYNIDLSPDEIEKRCVEYQLRLISILSSVAFVIKYKLITSKEIKIIKFKRKAPKYDHFFDVLSGIKFAFNQNSTILDQYADSCSVLVVKNINNPTEFLNLSPLIVDTRNEIFDTKEKLDALKKDIFLYSGFDRDNGRLFYSGTEATKRCNLSLLSNYEELLEEFKEYLTYFSCDKN